MVLGVAPFPLPEGRFPADLAARGFTPGTGLFIEYVFKDGPAARAGLQAGSLLLSLDGERLKDLDSYNSVLAPHRSGDTIHAQVWHDGVLREITIELEEAVTVFRRACDLGDPEGCQSAGTRLARVDGTPAGLAEAVSLLQRGCDGGSPSGCIALGNAHSNGDLGLPRDERQAVPLYQKACEQRVSAGCFNLARLYGRNPLSHDSLFDGAKALELYARVCGWGDAEACLQASRFTSTDEENLAFLRRGCELGDQRGCQFLKDKIEGPERARRKREQRARENSPEGMQQACDSGDLDKCTVLAMWYSVEGSQVPMDMEKALALATSACEKGYDRACEEALFYQGMTCVWSYRVAGQKYREGSRVGTKEECAREADTHVAATCRAAGLVGGSVQGAYSFRRERSGASKGFTKTCRPAP
jgi:TPR repeat protein